MKKIHILENKNFIIGLFMLIIPIILLSYVGINFKNHYIVPQLALIVMLISGVITLWKGLKIDFQDQNQSTDTSANISMIEVIGVIIFLLFATFFMEKIGFYFTLGVVLFIFNVYLRKRNGNEINLLKSGAFALITILITYLIFNNLLDLRVPSDVLLI